MRAGHLGGCVARELLDMCAAGEQEATIVLSCESMINDAFHHPRQRTLALLASSYLGIQVSP